MARTYLKICFDFEERTSELTPEEQGRLLLALLHYAASGEKERLFGNERFCYPAFCKDIDHDMEIYEGKVANGKQGGRPKRMQEETEQNQQKPKEPEQNQQEPKETEQNQRKGEETSIKNKNKSKKKEQEQEQDHEHEQEQEQGQFSILTYPPKSPQGGRGAGAKKEESSGIENFFFLQTISFTSSGEPVAVRRDSG